MTKFVDIPADDTIVVTEDKRVFIDMDYLIREFGAVIKGREFASNLTKNPEDIALSGGQRMMLDSIEAIRDTALIDVATPGDFQ